MALKTDGTMWLWGLNSYGGLGDGTALKRSSPVQIGALTSWSSIAAGGNHSAAIKTDGTLWTWGKNIFGQLGDNTVINRSSPVQIGSLTTWAQIAGGGNHSAAIKTDGTLWTFGYSTYTGQLGDNTVLRRSSPVQVGALTTWSKVALGYEHSMALKTDGTMWAWGNNGQGQLGDNTITYRSSPVQVGSLATWSSIACTGGANSIAIDTNKGWYSWGGDRIGDGVSIARSSPVQVGSDPRAETNHWAKISCHNHSIAISAE
jgi:alpha-tubulin suppressor-like RCC1 family protein